MASIDVKSELTSKDVKIIFRGNMNEIKLGDYVRVWCRFPFTGKVTGISDHNKNLLFVTEDGFYSCHNDAPFHRKQCELLEEE